MLDKNGGERPKRDQDKMEAPPNLERSSSLTWAGIGGLNWDRTAVIPSTEATGGGKGATTKTVRASSFSVRDTPSPPPPVSAVHALLAEDDEELLPPPSLLKRSVTFSGDFPHDPTSETLVATPPTLLGMSAGPGLQSFPRRQRATSDAVGPAGQVVQQRQRATSDAAAVKAAWGTSEPGSLSPEAAVFNYSPAVSQHKAIPRRSHSMSVEPSVWSTGGESPRERSRTAHTLSVGSPDTEVLEYLDGDDLGPFSIPPANRLGQLGSPHQHTMYPAHSAQPPTQQSHPPQQRYAPQAQQQAQTQSGDNQSQTYMSGRLTTPPFNMYSSTQPSPRATGSLPSSTPPTSASTHDMQQDGSFYELQMQNLQAMQMQWIQMMQMQLDHTMYSSQQRMHQPPTNSAPPSHHIVPPRVGKYPSANHMNGTHGGYESNQGYNTHPPSSTSGGPPSGMPGPMLYQGGNRSSPPSHRMHRRQQDNNTASAQSSQATSNLLSEHKISGRRLSAQELAGHVVEFSRDSHGSRLIQFKMETGTPEEKRMFVNEALPHTLSLARDLFGNYVVQNFFDNAAPDQRDMLAISLMGNVSALCTHPHGCRVVQRALFVVSPARRNDLIEELLELQGSNTAQTEAIVRSCARDAHATHVLQKAVAALQRAIGLKSAWREPAIPEDAEDPPNERARATKALEKIETIVLADCIPMSTHQQACRLVQRVLGACEPNKCSSRVNQLVSDVFKNIDALAIHQNGNFVLQHILEAADPALASKVQQYVCVNAIRLARHKFGSHLVEKCLACATPAQVNAVIDRFLSPLSPELLEEFKDDFESSAVDDTASGLVPSTLPVLMKDPYANFVVQKAFDVARGEQRAKLSQEIRARTASLSKFSYGRHILTHINRAGPGGGPSSSSAAQ